MVVACGCNIYPMLAEIVRVSAGSNREVVKEQKVEEKNVQITTSEKAKKTFKKNPDEPR